MRLNGRLLLADLRMITVPSIRQPPAILTNCVTNCFKTLAYDIGLFFGCN